VLANSNLDGGLYDIHSLERFSNLGLYHTYSDLHSRSRSDMNENPRDATAEVTFHFLMSNLISYKDQSIREN
jgi:hypothetical protein